MVRERTITGRGGISRSTIPYEAIFAENLKAARASMRLTQGLVGDPVGMTKRTVCRIENQHHGATLSTAGALAEALGFTLPQMLLPPREFAKLLPKRLT